MSSVVVCPSCGHENIRGEEVCGSCSSPLVALDKSPDRQSKTRITGDRIAELPLGPAEVIDARTSIREALPRLAGQNDACVIVTQEGKVAGIVTERDILYKVAGNESVLDAPLSSVMTADPVRVYSDDRVASAFNKMAVGGLRHLPVFEGERLTGVITVTTLLRYLQEHYPRPQ
jgi:CBS domain-containing protein